MRPFIIVVIIFGQRADVNQAFDRQILGLTKEAIISYPGDNHVELQADSLA